MNKLTSFALTAVCAALLSACSGDDGASGKDGVNGTNGTDGVSKYVSINDVVTSNARYAYAVYADSLIAAKQLDDALKLFVANPTEQTFSNAKAAWLSAREPYGQSEVLRFREGPIDNLTTDENGAPVLLPEQGPEGAINAWPLAEALIDYSQDMDGLQNPENIASLPVKGNMIENTEEFPVINKALLASEFARQGDEKNVTSGYHAIEFLLWGQDLNADGNYTHERDYTAGHRPVSDFIAEDGFCTSGAGNLVLKQTCERRAAYLLAASELLIDDLSAVLAAWQPETGFHYQAFVKPENAKQSLAKILEGMGRLSFGELAGERMSIAVRTDSQEDEHSCFSDNTHRDIWLNAKGIQNTFHAYYTRLNGETLQGASIYDLLVVEGHHELANELRAAIDDTMAKAAVIDTTARIGYAFDVQIQKPEYRAPINQTISALKAQTQVIKKAIEALGVTTGDLEQDTDEFGG